MLWFVVVSKARIAGRACAKLGSFVSFFNTGVFFSCKVLSGRNPINLAIPKRKSLRGLGGTFDGCSVLNALAFSLRDYGFEFSAENELLLN